MSVAPDLEGAEDNLYRHMKVSLGGVMLLVRLHADLLAYPSPTLERLKITEAAADLQGGLDPSSRLAVTLGMLRAKFGRANSVRSIVEAASDILVSRQPESAGGREAVSGR